MEIKMSTTQKFQYAYWTRTQRATGELIWVASYEVADHFHKKDALVKDMQALRTLELMAAMADVDSATQNALEYIKSQMIEINKKIIAANRKSDRMGWYCISDELMQKHIAGFYGEAA